MGREEKEESMMNDENKKKNKRRLVELVGIDQKMRLLVTDSHRRRPILLWDVAEQITDALAIMSTSNSLCESCRNINGINFSTEEFLVVVGDSIGDDEFSKARGINYGQSGTREYSVGDNGVDGSGSRGHEG